MEEHPRGDGNIELVVGEGELLRIADSRIDAPRTLLCHHRVRLVDADELDAELIDQPLGELPLAASDLEDTSRLRGCDRLERELAWVVPLRVGVSRLPGPQVLGRRVLLANELGLVDAQR
jgi:hypothetical protein